MRGARHFSELVVWQLADEIRVEMLKLTARAGFAQDLRLRSQTEDAINSTCRNIAEGFGCDTHGEFARFLIFARRSLNEVQDALRGAALKRYIVPADCTPIRGLLRRLYPAMSRFIAYLKRNPDRPWRPSERRARTRSPEPADPHKRVALTSELGTAQTKTIEIALTTEIEIAPTREAPIAPTSESRDRTDLRSPDRTDPRQSRSHRPAIVGSH